MNNETTTNPQVLPIAIEREVQDSYLNYAMSVIVSRALPDVRDGLKPVHRRILYAMYDLGLRSNSQHKKTGRIVGDVLGKYHPHGDQSIYDALVRLAQDFSLRYPLIDGQGNFGSIDNDPPAAMRYTEARLAKISDEMLRDIKRETVDFRPNYDESIQEPAVLPGALPNLLANGTSGIAVGMATLVPPHNLREIAEAVRYNIENPQCESRDLCTFVKGPDFPTGGIIYGAKYMHKVYEHGRGQIVIRGRVSVEQDKRDRESIIITELPYQVSKSALITRIATLAKEQKINGISDLRDESDRDGMRIVVGLKKDSSADIICNQLYHLTPLQSNINPNMLALVDGKPQLLNLKGLIDYYVIHRREIITRRSEYDLRINRERKHVLDGLLIAIHNIDAIIKTIRASENVQEARISLMNTFNLSERQAQAILDMRLQRLTNLERIKVEQELGEVIATIEHLEQLLASKTKIDQLVVRELEDIVQQFGDDRRTELVDEHVDSLVKEELIHAEKVVFMLSDMGYVKRMPVSSFRPQTRGGKGSAASAGKDGDTTLQVLYGLTTEFVFIVSTAGKCYKLRLHDIPVASRTAKGRHVRGLISIGSDEKIAQSLIVPDFEKKGSLLFVTAKGVAKRTALNKFATVKTRGIVAIKLTSKDRLISALMSHNKNECYFFSASGKGLRVSGASFRDMERSTRGINAMSLSDDDVLVGAVNVEENGTILLVTERGYAKRVSFDVLQRHNRGTKGQIVFPTSEKTGRLLTALVVQEDESALFACSSGNVVVTHITEISRQQKTARGVRCAQLSADERVLVVESLVI